MIYEIIAWVCAIALGVVGVIIIGLALYIIAQLITDIIYLIMRRKKK